jgi:hypothetical protein
MKTSILPAMLALTAASAVVVATVPANAQSWMDIARNPVPSYQPFRGYNGAQTYIGQDYSNLGGGNVGSGNIGSGSQSMGEALSDIGLALEEAAEEVEHGEHEEDCW